jgi:hypothetical protein
MKALQKMIFINKRLKRTVMRKIIVIALFAIICKNGFCTEKAEGTGVNEKYTVERLFNSFSKEKNAVHVKVSTSLFRIFADTKGVTNIEVYSFDECNGKLKDNLNDAIKKLKDSAYETVISSNENGNVTKILLKIKEDIINEIIVVTGGDSPAMVRIKGKIKREDVEDVIKNNK